MKKLLIILLVAAAVGGVWLFVKPSGAVVAEGASPTARVETTALLDQPIAQSIEAFGVVAAAPSADRVTSAPYDVVVRKVHVSIGALVAAGDVLLEVDPSPDSRLAAESAQGALVLATRALAAAQERFDLKLATNQELIAAQQVADDAKLRADSFSARGFGGDGRITAVEPGVVSKIDVSAGALVPAGSALVTVTTGGRLEARLGIEAAEVGAVTAGQPVSLESASRTGPEKVATEVRAVGAVLDPATGAAEVRASLPAGAPLLLGEHVRAQIEVARRDHALVVPRRAVLPDDDRQILFTIRAGKAVRHEVQLGLVAGEQVEVTGADLRRGDLVVTQGNYELEDGMAVRSPDGAATKDEAQDAAKSAPEAKP